MNKFLRKAMVLALAGTMTIGMGTTVFADSTDVARDNTSKLTNAGSEVTSDTDTISLVKNYVRGENTATDSVSPEENFEFTITPYGVWNAGSSNGMASGAAYTVKNMPSLAKTTTEYIQIDSNNVTTVTVQASEGQVGKNTDIKTEIPLNDFYSVGDFWYAVVESQKNTTGVFYGTNNGTTDTRVSNGGHNTTYYIHVQVVNNPVYGTKNAPENTQKFLRSVTMHKTAPTKDNGNDAPTTNTEYNAWTEKNNNYKANAKVNDIQNTYYAGDLSIKKVVTGNSGDKDKRFKVTVTFTKPAGTIITSNIKYSAVTTENGTTELNQTIYNQSDANDSSWKTGTEDNAQRINENSEAIAYAKVKFWIKDGETVTFKNIPYGVTYTVAETKPADNTYTNKFTFTNADIATTFNDKSLAEDSGKQNKDNAKENTGDFFGTEEGKFASGSISDESDVLTITNYKESVIDIGVITSNAPYVAVLIFAVAALVIYTRRRKDMFEE